MSESETNSESSSSAPKLAEISAPVPDFTSQPVITPTIISNNCSSSSSIAAALGVTVDRPSVTFVPTTTNTTIVKPTTNGNNHVHDTDNTIGELTTTKLSSTIDADDERPRRYSKRLSAPSAAIVDKSKELLNAQPSSIKVEAEVEMMLNRSSASSRLSPDTRRLRDLYTPDTDSSTYSSVRAPLHTRRFPRIDFDDVVEEALTDRRPAWKQLQESIKDSYHRANRAVDRSKQEAEFMDGLVSNDSDGRRRRRAAVDRDQSPFSHLDSESLTLRKPSWFASGAMQPRGLTASGGRDTAVSTTTTSSSGPYAAPAVAASAGIESRYERRANEIESRLLRTSVLKPDHRTARQHITTKEMRNAPAPAAGSMSEAFVDEADYLTFMPRPYYSRPNRDDPDYFDFDLQHSVNLFKRPEGRYVPRGPQEWEQKLLGEMKGKGDAPLSGHMFTAKGSGGSASDDWRTNGTSYLSAALRTPSFWEARFTNIGKEARDRNTVTMESIARNKPVPSRFTEYRDPDLDGCDSPYDSD